jgi:UDP-glucose 4-epimerase
MSFSFDGATVLITGGAGFVGSHIADQLFAAGAAEVRTLDNLIRGRRENLEAAARHRLKLLIGDVRDREAVRSAVAGCDYVFHQAALRITLCADKPRDCIDVLCTGTLNVFEAAVAAKVRKVVYASSASVYGAAETYPTAESHHPYGNRTLYGAAKLFNEGIANVFYDGYGLPAVGLRYFNVYGPRMDLTGAYTEVFIRWLDCVDKNVRPVIHGDGSATMDFVYVDDIARANLLALTSDSDNHVYNVASGGETSLLDLWRSIQRVTGAYHLEPEFHPPRKVNPVPRRLADTSKAERELGFVSRVTLDEGVRRLVEWRREAQRAAAATVSDPTPYPFPMAFAADPQPVAKASGVTK